MTGSFAVVMAALVPLRGVGAEERGDVLRVVRHSRFDMGETALRIEASARSQGMSVLARINGERLVIVLGSSIGGTPVVMEEADSRPAVPLSVVVRAGADGGSDVLIASAAQRGHASAWGLPSEVTNDLASLPLLVDRALST